MATPRTEVILAPKVDRQDLNKVKQNMNAAFDDVATKNKKELEKGTKDGVSKGLKDGGKEGLGHLKKGLAGIAAIVGAAALNAVMGADEVVARMEQRLIGVRDIVKEAAAFDVSSGEYAQVSSIFTALGYDQSDVRGLLAGFQAELEKPEMEKFKNIADQDGVMQSMLSFIAATQGMTQSERAKRLGPLGDEDAVISSAIAAQIAKTQSTNLQELFTSITGETYTAGQITKGIERNRLESERLARYQSGVYIQDLMKGGNAGQIIQSQELDRRLNAAHDRNIEQKLMAKEIMVTAEIASIDAASATIEGFKPWLDNATSVISDLEGALKKTGEMGAAQILQYKPFSTNPNREVDPLLDLFFRGPFWDWMQAQEAKNTQQNYTK